MPKVAPKARCCKDRPRCRRCPVVLERLARAGLARPTKGGNYRVPGDLTKKRLKPFRG